MEARVQINNPDEVMATVTVTMPLRDWRGLKSQLCNAYPSWKFGSVISDVIRQAEQSFYGADKEPT